MVLLDIHHIMSKFYRFLVLIVVKMSNGSAYFDMSIILTRKEKEVLMSVNKKIVINFIGHN